MPSISIKAPAKVNIVLRVIGKRADGYHDLEMVMVPLSLADEIELIEISSGIELEIAGEADAGMAAEKNLAWRAAKLVKDNAGIKSGVKIHLTKRTPVAAGLGGGSSDAASVLVGLNRLWKLGWQPAQLADIGKALGADVPFFCYERPAFVEGIGDRITPYEKFPKLVFLLINPGFAVPTPWVYKQWDSQHTPNEIRELTPKKGDARVRPLETPMGRECPRFADFSDVVSSLHNDLEKVTIPAYPEIAKIKKFLLDAGAAGALMSGSGPTVFGIFENEPLRDEALSKVVEKNWRAFAAGHGFLS